MSNGSGREAMLGLVVPFVSKISKLDVERAVRLAGGGGSNNGRRVERWLVVLFGWEACGVELS